MYTAVSSITEHDDTVTRVSFSEDGKYVATGDESGLLIVSETSEIDNFDRYYFIDSITTLIWIPGTLSLFVGLANCELHYLSLEEDRAYTHNVCPDGYVDLPPHWQDLIQVNCLAFDSSGRYLAIGVGVTAVVLSNPDWRINTYQQECIVSPIVDMLAQIDTSQEPPEALSAEVRSVHFLKSGHNLVVTFIEQGVRCYDTRTKAQLWHLRPRSFRIGRSSIDSRDKLLVCSNLSDGFDVYDIETQEHLRNIRAEVTPDTNVWLPAEFIRNGSSILLGSPRGSVRLLPLDGDALSPVSLRHGTDIIQAIAYVEQLDGTSWIAVGCSERGLETYVRLWRNTANGELEAEDAIMAELRGTGNTKEPGLRLKSLLPRSAGSRRPQGVEISRSIPAHSSENPEDYRKTELGDRRRGRDVRYMDDSQGGLGCCVRLGLLTVTILIISVILASPWVQQKVRVILRAMLVEKEEVLYPTE